MAVGRADEVIHAPGQLCINPTDLTIPFPHGGTAIGEVAEIIYSVEELRHVIPAEEFGSEPVEVIEGGKIVTLSCFLRGFDVDAMQTAFQDAAQSVKTKKATIEFPGATPAGHLMSDDSVVLLFSPRSTEDVPAVILYRALPHLQETADMRFSFDQELGMPVIFQGVRDASSRVSSMKLLEDITL